MNITVFILIAVFAGAALGIMAAWFFTRRHLKTPQKDEGSMLLIQNQLNELARVVDEKLGASHRQMHDSVRQQFGESQKLIREITEELTHVKETGRRMIGFADELRHLQDVLQNPKQRGVLGEYYLETVLKNVLPPGRYETQYKFSDGEIVDAVVHLDKGKLLPIDSKFSLENYNKILETNDAAEKERLEKLFKQDLKNRIDETAKYIRPKEGTLDHAFMFIPSEAIYYDLLVNQVGAIKSNTRDLIEYAFVKRHVVIVSPTTFLAYLQTVMQGLRSLRIEEQAQEIIKRVGELGRHVENYESFMGKLGTALGTTVSHYNKSYKELGKIGKDVRRITGKTLDIEPEQLEKPVQEIEE